MRWTVEDSDRLTAALVVLDGHRMPLNTAERIQAIRLAVRHGLDREELARRVGVNIRTLWRFAERHGEQLPPVPEPSHLAEIMNSSRRADRRREAAARARLASAAVR